MHTLNFPLPEAGDRFAPFKKSKLIHKLFCVPVYRQDLKIIRQRRIFGRIMLAEYSYSAIAKNRYSFHPYILSSFSQVPLLDPWFSVCDGFIPSHNSCYWFRNLRTIEHVLRMTAFCMLVCVCSGICNVFRPFINV